MRTRSRWVEAGLALFFGLALGLWIAWGLAPVEYTDAPPSLLRADFKDEYRLLIARAYLATGDLARAQQRLAALEDPSPPQALALQAQAMLAAGAPRVDAEALALLAQDLRGGLVADLPAPSRQPLATGTQAFAATLPPLRTATPTFTPTPTPSNTPTPVPPTRTGTPGTPDVTATHPLTRTPTITPTRGQPATPTPSPTPSPTPGLPFIVFERQIICDPALPPGLLEVYARDAAWQPVAGVKLVLRWEGQETPFFTGLQPEKDPGYADALLLPEVVYALEVFPGGTYIQEVVAPQCTTDAGEPFYGVLRLTLRQP